MDTSSGLWPNGERLTSTCLIITYDQESTIREAIQSALDQTVPFDEIIVVDDGSTDDTPEIAQTFARSGRVRLIDSPRLGPQGALNLALEATSSDVAFLLGGDDVCLPRRVERQTETLMLTGADGVFCLPVLIDEGGLRLRDAVRPELFQLPTEDSLLLQLLVRGNFLCGPTAALRVASLPEAPVFNPGLKYAQDYDLWLRMLLSGSTLCVDDERVVAYRVHHSSLSGDPSLRNEFEREARKVRVSALSAALAMAASTDGDALGEVAAFEKHISEAIMLLRTTWA